MTTRLLLLATNDKKRANWEKSGTAVYYISKESRFYEKTNEIFEDVRKYINEKNTFYPAIGHYTGAISDEDFYYLHIQKVEKNEKSFIVTYRSFRCSNKSSKLIIEKKTFENLLVDSLEFSEMDKVVDKNYFKTLIFIGSSSESKILANSLCAILQDTYRDNLIIKPWWNEFEPNDITINKLIDIAQYVDKAIFILSNDDYLTSRDVKLSVPRDNVIFEYGLFIGAKGLKNVHIVCKEGVKKPTDINGLTYIQYKDDLKSDFNAIQKLAELYVAD